jgi:hypothetical protein
MTDWKNVIVLLCEKKEDKMDPGTAMCYNYS